MTLAVLGGEGGFFYFRPAKVTHKVSGASKLGFRNCLTLTLTLLPYTCSGPEWGHTARSPKCLVVMEPWERGPEK